MSSPYYNRHDLIWHESAICKAHAAEMEPFIREAYTKKERLSMVRGVTLAGLKRGLHTAYEIAAQSARVKNTQVTEALIRLLKLGQVRRVSDGRYELTESAA